MVAYDFSNGYASPALSLSGAGNVVGQRSKPARVFWVACERSFLTLVYVRRIGRRRVRECRRPRDHQGRGAPLTRWPGDGPIVDGHFVLGDIQRRRR